MRNKKYFRISFIYLLYSLFKTSNYPTSILLRRYIKYNCIVVISMQSITCTCISDEYKRRSLPEGTWSHPRIFLFQGAQLFHCYYYPPPPSLMLNIVLNNLPFAKYPYLHDSCTFIDLLM